MKALVLYESIFGNTGTIAEAIAEGLASAMGVTVTEVGSAPVEIPDDVNLLVIGGPTHQFGMSRASSRETVARDPLRRPDASRSGVREWLDQRPRSHDRLSTAVFCTVMTKPRFLRYIGSAGKSIRKRLKQLGFAVIDPPQTFWVTGTAGPLVDGEVERARGWGESLAASVQAETREPILLQ